MDKATYTKGPWHAPHFTRDEIDCNCGYIFAEGSRMGSIATVNFDNGKSIEEGGNDCPPLEEAKANARLIAAAPDLVEALQDLSIFYGDDAAAREVLRSDFTGPEPLLMDDDALRKSVWINARAALSKALGEGQDSNG